MSWIKTINENEASGELKNIYKNIIKKRGKLSNIMRIHSLNPKVMEKHMDLYLSVMFGKSDISRKDRELIAVFVSSLNKCDYCINHHAEALNHYWKDDDKIKDLINNYKSINLSEKKLAMMDYVYKLTKKPEIIKQSDIDILRENGFQDKDILDINLIVSYFNFVNRIVLGLDVDFSKDEIKGYKY
jgi:uncharacterized peroxidase-related enzyme